jgi:hypothetical protein
MFSNSIFRGSWWDKSRLSWQQRSSLGQRQSLNQATEKESDWCCFKFKYLIWIRSTLQLWCTFSEVALKALQHMSQVPHPSSSSGLAPDGLHTPVVWNDEPLCQYLLMQSKCSNLTTSLKMIHLQKLYQSTGKHLQLLGYMLTANVPTKPLFYNTLQT